MKYNKKFKSDIEVFNKHTSPQQREEQIISDADIKSNYLPKSISIEDIDIEIDRQFKEDKFMLILEDEPDDRQLVPSIFLTNERWGEFSKTWQLMDQDKNIAPPFITINKIPNYSQGSYAGVKWNIPNGKFPYIKVPYYEHGGFGYEVYSVPQPTAIDLTYEIRFFTRYAIDVNEFVELFAINFNSLQYYIKVNGQYFRVIMEESFSDESTVETIDQDKYYVSVQTIRVMGYILKEKDFKVVKSYNRTGITTKSADDGSLLNKTTL